MLIVPCIVLCEVGEPRRPEVQYCRCGVRRNPYVGADGVLRCLVCNAEERPEAERSKR